MDAKDERFLNGPALEIVDWAIKTAQSLSIVEHSKSLAIRISRANSLAEKRRIANIAIDLFIAAKWSLLLLCWCQGFSNPVVVAVIVYLLLMNGHTYFFYHLWKSESPGAVVHSESRDKRRFINLVSAMGYSVVAPN